MNNLKPLTRDEVFLAKLGGQDVELPTPVTRDEMFLADIIETQSSEGGGSGGAFIVEYTIEESGGEHTVTNASHTYAEIKQAIADGKIVVARQVFDDGTLSEYPMIETDENNNTVYFRGLSIDDVRGNIVATKISLTHGFYNDADVYEFSVEPIVLRNAIA